MEVLTVVNANPSLVIEYKFLSKTISSAKICKDVVDRCREWKKKSISWNHIPEITMELHTNHLVEEAGHAPVGLSSKFVFCNFCYILNPFILTKQFEAVWSLSRDHKKTTRVNRSRDKPVDLATNFALERIWMLLNSKQSRHGLNGLVFFPAQKISLLTEEKRVGIGTHCRLPFTRVIHI